jgi:peptide deformylase
MFRFPDQPRSMAARPAIPRGVLPGRHCYRLAPLNLSPVAKPAIDEAPDALELAGRALTARGDPEVPGEPGEPADPELLGDPEDRESLGDPEDPESLGDPEDPDEPEDPELSGEDEDEEHEEEELDPELAARRAAALAHVRTFGDPVLRTRARPVDRFDQTLRDEIRRMGELMDDAIGVGLAATQVGVLHRLLVYRVLAQAPMAALINPEIEWSGKEQEIMEEGCLSLPGVHVDVERAIDVRVRAQNEFGEQILIEASGLEARVIQHEVDHLDGVLILDRISRQERKEAMRALREAQSAV